MIWGYILAGLVVASTAMASDFVLTGPITHVRDGDTIVVAGQPVRLKGIAAPESKEAGGPEATAALRAIEGRQVVCHLTGEANYDRMVGWCSLLGADLGDLQLAAGLVRRCPSFDPAKRYPDGAGSMLPLPAYCMKP